MRSSGTLSRRESPARRLGVILSVVFLTSLGTVATLTSTRASAQSQTDVQAESAPLPFSTGL